jgi:hypothetical protein
MVSMQKFRLFQFTSRAIQPPLVGKIQFMSRGSVANIKANKSGSDFLGTSSTISTFVFKIISQPGIKEPN